MFFKQSGKDSNNIMSKSRFNSFIFLTQFLQLMTDFYLGFYICHMIQRGEFRPALVLSPLPLIVVPHLEKCVSSTQTSRRTPQSRSASPPTSAG